MIRVLIVDDVKDDVDDITAAAREAGLSEDSLTVARTEGEANAHIRDYEFDLAVIDLCLSLPQKQPGKEEGLDVIARLHEEQPACRIIAKTTHRGLREAREALARGANDVVSSKWELLDWRTLLRQRLDFWRRMIDPSS